MSEEVLENLKELCQVLEERSHRFSTNRKFLIELGRKNYKVIAQDEDTNGNLISRHAHCFVDKENGNIFKAASWSSAAKGVRYNLLDSASRSLLMEEADVHGGYLYRQSLP